MMEDIATVRFLGHELGGRILPVFIEGVARIPQSGLEFRPTPENMSAKELAYHVPQVVFLLTRTIKTGRFDTGDVPLLGSDPAAFQSPGELADYAQRATEYLVEVITSLSEADVERSLAEAPHDSVLDVLMLATEEAIHHRGQLSTYLRLLGVTPPGLYERP